MAVTRRGWVAHGALSHAVDISRKHACMKPRCASVSACQLSPAAAPGAPGVRHAAALLHTASRPLPAAPADAALVSRLAARLLGPCLSRPEARGWRCRGPPAAPGCNCTGSCASKGRAGRGRERVGAQTGCMAGWSSAWPARGACACFPWLQRGQPCACTGPQAPIQPGRRQAAQSCMRACRLPGAQALVQTCRGRPQLHPPPPAPPLPPAGDHSVGVHQRQQQLLRLHAAHAEQPLQQLGRELVEGAAEGHDNLGAQPRGGRRCLRRRCLRRLCSSQCWFWWAACGICCRCCLRRWPFSVGCWLCCCCYRWRCCRRAFCCSLLCRLPWWWSPWCCWGLCWLHSSSGGCCCLAISGTASCVCRARLTAAGALLLCTLLRCRRLVLTPLLIMLLLLLLLLLLF